MFLMKLLFANLLIISCVLIGKRSPSLGGLLATMPLTSLIVLVWLYSDDPTRVTRIDGYVLGVLWGIIPTIAFFGALLYCLRRGVGVPASLVAAAACWVTGAVLHRLLLQG